MGAIDTIANVLLVWLGYNMVILLSFSIGLYIHRDDEESLKNLLSEPSWGKWHEGIVKAFLWTLFFPVAFTVHTLDLLTKRYEWLSQNEDGEK